MAVAAPRGRSFEQNEGSGGSARGDGRVRFGPVCLAVCVSISAVESAVVLAQLLTRDVEAKQVVFLILINVSK